jgi:hypothetical protein
MKVKRGKIEKGIKIEVGTIRVSLQSLCRRLSSS